MSGGLDVRESLGLENRPSDAAQYPSLPRGTMTEQLLALGDETSRVLDALPRAIIVHAFDGTVLGWNVSAERIFGWARDAVIRKRFSEPIILPIDSASSEIIVARARRGKDWSGELSARRADGEVIRVRAFVSPLRAEDGTVIGTVTAADDVTQFRELEQRATDLANHLVLALAAGDLGTWTWDLATGITTWDDTVSRLFGVAPGDFGGAAEEWIALLHPDDVDTTLATFRDALAAAGPFEFEHRVRWADGSVHWLHGRGDVTIDEDGEVTGAIGCTSDITVRKLAELEARQLASDADAAATQERIQRERLEFLATLNESTLAASNLRELMGMITSAAVPRLGDWCTLHYIGEPNAMPLVEVAHVDPSKMAWVEELQTRYPYDPDAPTGVPAVIRSGTPEFVQIDDEFIEAAISESAVPEDEAREIVEVLHLTSLITVPLRTKRGVVGAMQFVSAESERRYDDDDLALALAAAGRIAAALDNTWLSEQHRHVSSALQEAILPLGVPGIDGATVAVRYWAAGAVNEVGGDFYDIFQLTPTRWAVVIGDVCGTGPQAAAVTAKARHTIRAAATHGTGHVECLEWVNDAILAGGRGRFCTVMYSTLDRNPDGTWSFTSVAGGHPLPVQVAADGHGTRLGRPGTLIGAVRPIQLHSAVTTLHAGDTLVAYTDGITDVRPPFGLDDQAAVDLIATAAASGLDAEHIAGRIELALTHILPIPDRGDDIALVVIHLNDLDT